MPHVELTGLAKSFGGFQALQDITLTIEKGEFCALLGPSGCGKSTLLRVIAGLEDATQGSITIGGRDVTQMEPADRRIAMVFQSYALYPHMTVADNIAFSLEVQGLPRSARRTRAAEVARTLQLDHLLDRKPAHLSGGQRQRVAIGRALVRDPQVFLFDEPLSNLDAALRVQMRMELSNLHQTLAATMIYVTHDQVEAMTMADRIVVLDQGRIRQIGAPMDLYKMPADRFVAGFIGSPAMNFLPARVTDAGSSLTLDLGQGSRPVHVTPRHPVSPGLTQVDLGLRPEHVTLLAPDAPESVLPAKVRLVERLGNQTVIYLDSVAGTVTLQGFGDLPARSGDLVALGFDLTQAHVFAPDGQAL